MNDFSPEILEKMDIILYQILNKIIDIKKNQKNLYSVLKVYLNRMSVSKCEYIYASQNYCFEIPCSTYIKLLEEIGFVITYEGRTGYTLEWSLKNFQQKLKKYTSEKQKKIIHFE